MKNYLTALLFIITVIFSANAANADVSTAETEWKASPKNEGAARLIIGGVAEDGKIYAGIELKFKGKWHTYWKHPGETGAPLTLVDKGSENIKNLELKWPIPKRIKTFNIESWIYGQPEVLIGERNKFIGNNILPIIIQPADASKPVNLNLELKWAICDEICLFEKAEFKKSIASGYKFDLHVNKIKESLKFVPENIENSNIDLNNIDILDDKLIISFSSKTKFSDKIDLFIYEESKNFKFPKPQISYSADGKNLTILAPYSTLIDGKTLDGKTLEMVLANGKNSVELKYKVEPKIAVAVNSAEEASDEGLKKKSLNSNSSSPTGNINLFTAILFAIIGGLILNVMPCVLPVLSIKVLGMIKNHGSDRTYIRKSFLFTILGILFSFMVIAAFTVSLKSAGQIAGWGTQFQNAGFLIFLALICFLFAINLMGFFEVYLPSFLGGRLNDTINKSEKSPLLANFLTGAFATLMATPCTAPFLGSAIAFSLSSTATNIFIIFFFMGVGLALPYIIFMTFPSAVRFLPKPGAWMEKVKVFFGILLFFTFLWLVYILISSGRLFAGIMLFQLCIILWGFAWYAKRKSLDIKRTLMSISWGVLCTFAVCFWLAENIEKPRPEMDKLWVKYEPGLVEKYVANGDLVFVDVTADWCLTCKFNKANVVMPMLGWLQENEVVLIKADYTNSDIEVARYLSKNKAYAIPFNKVYGANAKEGIQLPALLTEKAVKNAINNAR